VHAAKHPCRIPFLQGYFGLDIYEAKIVSFEENRRTLIGFRHIQLHRC